MSVQRPWGDFLTHYSGNNYAIKTINVNPEQRISLQRHRWRDEHWFIVEGRAIVEKANELWYINSGQTIDIPKGTWHRVTNKEKTPLVFVEVQTGNCFEEDIERKEDDYGRV